MLNNLKNSGADSIAIIKNLPGFREAEAREHTRLVQARQARIDEIAKINAAALKAVPFQEKRKEEALNVLKAARLALREAEQNYRQVDGEIFSEKFAWANQREECVAFLLDADFDLVNAFVHECLDETEKARRSLTVETSVQRNQISGDRTRVSNSNIQKIRARLKAIDESREAALEFRLLADLRDLPHKIAALRLTWPSLDDAKILKGDSK